jgi:hypothetical protein
MLLQLKLNNHEMDLNFYPAAKSIPNPSISVRKKVQLRVQLKPLVPLEARDFVFYGMLYKK